MASVDRQAFLGCLASLVHVGKVDQMGLVGFPGYNGDPVSGSSFLNVNLIIEFLPIILILLLV